MAYPTTISIILGASEWPSCGLPSLIQCKHSAKFFKSYLQQLGLGDDKILYKFDSPDSPEALLGCMEDFLKENQQHQALMLFYVGHGIFDGDQYCLSLRCTESAHVASTSLSVDNIRSTLSLYCARMLKLVFLDSCFAASALPGFSGLSAGSSQHLADKVAERIRMRASRDAAAFREGDPSHGTVLFCSANPHEQARVSLKDQYTMYSSAVRTVLTGGDKDSDPYLTFIWFHELVKAAIHRQYGDSAIDPQIHELPQGRHSLLMIPFFPNPARPLSSPHAIYDCIRQELLNPLENPYITARYNKYQNIELHKTTDLACFLPFFDKILRSRYHTSDTASPTLHLISSLLPDPRMPDAEIRENLTSRVFLQGAYGTGKSILAWIVFHYLLCLHKERSDSPWPVLIDASYYMKQVYPTPHAKTRFARHLAATTLKHIADIINKDENAKIILIIDSLSSSNTYSLDILDEALRVFPAIQIVSYLLVVSEYYRQTILDTKLFWPTDHFDTTFDLEQIYDVSDSAVFSHFVDLYTHLRGACSTDPNPGSLLQQNVQRLKPMTVDAFTLEVLLEKLHEPAYRVHDLSQFFELYCTDQLGAAPIAEHLDTVSRLAFHTHILREEYSQDALINQQMEWELLHGHSHIRNFLVARHILYLIVNASSAEAQREIVNKRAFAVMFPKDVNFFVKQLMNQPDTRDSVYNGLLGLLKILPENHLIYIYYLLGLFDHLDIARAAIGTLNDNKGRILDSLRTEVGDRQRRVRLLTLLRSIYVSLLYLDLEREEAWHQYLKRLLADEDERSINRGVFRVYYGDKVARHIDDQAIFYDRDGGVWARSRDALETAIEKYLSGIRPRANTSRMKFLVFTLASFAQTHFQKGDLTSAERARIVTILRRISNTDLLKGDRELSNYVESLLADMLDMSFSIFGFIADLFRLKFRKRIDWVERLSDKSPEGIRPESPADHMYGAYILAKIMLEDVRPGRTQYKYNKQKVLDMLLVHDIAQAYVADCNVERAVLRTCKEKIVSHIGAKGTYERVYGCNGIVEACDEYYNSNKQSYDSKLAKDFSNLEDAFQLCLFRDFIHEYHNEMKKIEGELRTDEVKNIFTQLAKWSDENDPSKRIFTEEQTLKSISVFDPKKRAAELAVQ